MHVGLTRAASGGPIDLIVDSNVDDGTVGVWIIDDVSDRIQSVTAGAA